MKKETKDFLIAQDLQDDLLGLLSIDGKILKSIQLSQLLDDFLSDNLNDEKKKITINPNKVIKSNPMFKREG